jgi:hypothetical protein
VDKRREPVGLLVLAAVATLAFIQSYARWLNPLIDTGRDLYIPEQLLRGARLYGDIRYQYPPLAPYLLALITRVIGHSLAAYLAIGLAQSLAAATALYLAARKAAGMVGAFGATLLFIALCFTNATTWGVTWLFPYSYAATFGMTFLLIALAALLHERPALAMAALVAASWCKIELAAAAALIVFGLTVARRIPLRFALAWGASMLATFGVAAFCFRDTGWLTGNLFATSLVHGEAARLFFARVSGTADWRNNLGEAVIGIAVIAVTAWLLRRRLWIPAAIVAALGAVAGNEPLIRAFGLLQWAVAVASWRDRDRPLFTVALFSIAATLRIWLNVSSGWYGFTLVLPVFVLMMAVLLDERLAPHAAVAEGRAAAVWLIPVAIMSVRTLADQRARYAVKTHPIVSMRGTLYDANADRASILDDFLRHVSSGTLVVIPEGLTLNYLSGATTPLTYHTLTPVEIDDPRIEDAILRELDAHPPDRIVILDRDVREFGYRGFGTDYGVKIAAWINAHYAPEAQLRKPAFWMVVLKRATTP